MSELWDKQKGSLFMKHHVELRGIIGGGWRGLQTTQEFMIWTFPVNYL